MSKVRKAILGMAVELSSRDLQVTIVVHVPYGPYHASQSI